MKLSILETHPSDLPSVEEIAKEAYSQHKSKVSSQLWHDWINGVISSLRSGKGTIIILRENENIVGTIQFYLDASQSELDGWPKGSNSGCLRVFAVRPKDQDKGYGTVLINYCIKQAKDVGLSKLFLHTGHINESAVHIFEKIGFKRLPKFDFYPYGQKDHVALAYELNL